MSAIWLYVRALSRSEGRPGTLLSMNRRIRKPWRATKYRFFSRSDSAMAATMYTIRATLAEKEYALFEALTTTGVSVTKHPFRSGRPSKKTFQLSLVQGDMYLYMYLTWKGKRTSIQGVELASVIRISRGRDTDVLRRTGKVKDSDRYLSLVTQDRSLDLCFDDEEQRELWWRTMTALVDVERAVRAAASGPDSPPPPPPNAPKPP